MYGREPLKIPGSFLAYRPSKIAKHTVKRKYMEATTEDRDAEFICSMIDKKMRAVESDSSECYDAK